MKRIVLITVVVLALRVAGTEAYPFTPGLNRAYQDAVHYWGGEPSRCSSLDKEIVPNGALPEGASGWATIPASGAFTPCVLYVSRWLAKPLEWGVACRVIVHEMGHLHGLQHNATPGDVMNPETTQMPPICAKRVDRETRFAGI